MHFSNFFFLELRNKFNPFEGFLLSCDGHDESSLQYKCLSKSFVCFSVGLSTVFLIIFRICIHSTYEPFIEYIGNILFHSVARFFNFPSIKTLFAKKYIINISLPGQGCLHCNRDINSLSKDEGLMVEFPLAVQYVRKFTVAHPGISSVIAQS